MTHFLHDVPPEARDAAAKDHEADLLVSKDLPDRWGRLDEFEGVRYERQLGLYRGDGALGIGNVYVWQHPDDSLI